MSPETYHTIYVICALALGWTAHMAFRMAMDYHDAKKNHEIRRLQWENDQLRRRVRQDTGEAPMPMAETEPELQTANAKASPAPRQRRSPAKAENMPVQPFKNGARKVPQGIPQADLGRMQAQLKATGAARIIYNGGTRLWN